MDKNQWLDKISNPAQVGGIETSVLDNGPGKGTRIAWINTGTGLRYKVVIDRAMDIADAFYNQHSLAWLSHVGVTSPQPFSHRGMDWLTTFGGGLLTTCGLMHVGGPEADEFGERGLHGGVSNIPAAIESIIQPDPVRGKFDMSITGRIKQTKVFGPSLELKRTISGILGNPVLNIHDEVTNVANTEAPHMLLYHFNFGWPLVDEGTDIIWKGTWKSDGGDPKTKIFKEGNNFKTCPPVLKEHSGSGEDVAVIDPVASDSGKCECGLYNKKLGFVVALKFEKKQLPYLTNWQHWGKGEYVNGLEPGTCAPIGQARARKEKQLIFLAPGEMKSYDIQLEIVDNEKSIDEFLKKNKS